MTSSRRPKVLMVGFCPAFGSISDEFRTLARTLPDFADLTIMCPASLNLEPSALTALHNLNYSTENMFGFLNSEWFRLVGKLRQENFDAVFYYTQHILNVLVAQLLPSRNQIIWWHEPEPGSRTTLLKRLLFAIHDPVMVGKSRSVIISCDELRTRVPMRFRDRLKVLPLAFIEAADIDASADPRFESDALYFGVVHGYKGLDILADAIDLLNKQGVPIRVTVIGRGDMQQHCPRLLQQSKEQPDRVRVWNSFESYQTIASALRSTRCLVLPYRSATGTSTVAIAYRQSKPVIATRVGCLPDYVQDGKTGWIIEPENVNALAAALKFVHDHPEIAEKFGAAGRELLEKRFRGRAVAEGLAEIMRGETLELPVQPSGSSR